MQSFFCNKMFLLFCVKKNDDDFKCWVSYSLVDRCSVNRRSPDKALTNLLCSNSRIIPVYPKTMTMQLFVTLVEPIWNKELCRVIVIESLLFSKLKLMAIGCHPAHFQNNNYHNAQFISYTSGQCDTYMKNVFA